MDELDIGLSKKSKIIEIGSVEKKLWLFKVGEISTKIREGGRLPPILLQPIVAENQLSLNLTDEFIAFEYFQDSWFQKIDWKRVR